MKKTVLVVDDSLFVYEEMKHMLKDSEFDIIAYSKTGEEAFDKYEISKPDVVTMDIILPGIDGIDASKIILSRYPKARIMIVSSLAYDDTIKQANSIGINHFVYKPFTKEELIDALNQTVDET